MINTIKQARLITGGDISNKNSKMLGSSFGLSTDYCKTGKALSKIAGSVCHQCYAKRGTGTYSNVKQGRLNNTLHVIDHVNNKEGREQWINAMVYLINKRSNGYMRFHDSGDLQSLAHFKAILEIARRLPAIRFWLPSKEKRIIEAYKGSLPPNIVVRLSSAMIDSKPPKTRYNTSSVHKLNNAIGFACPAPDQGNQCGTCSACYNSTIENVSYHKH